MEKIIVENTLKNIKELKRNIADVAKLLTTVESSLGGVLLMGKGSTPLDSQQLLGIMGLANESQSSIKRMEGQLLYALMTEALQAGQAALSTSQKEPSGSLLTLVKES